MKVYMDNCCFNRIFDDRSQPVIYFDRNSVMIVLELTPLIISFISFSELRGCTILAIAPTKFTP